MATSFSGGGSRKEPPTMGKQLVNFISTKPYRITGADPGFQVREGALKQIAPNGERR